MCSGLVDENTGLGITIQSSPLEDLESLIIPLRIHSGVSEQITVRIAESDFPRSTDVYIEDIDNKTFTSQNTSDFVITPSEALDATGRFSLRFSMESLPMLENELDD